MALAKKKTPDSGIKIAAHPFVAKRGIHGSDCGPLPRNATWEAVPPFTQAVWIGRSPHRRVQGRPATHPVALPMADHIKKRLTDWLVSQNRHEDAKSGAYLPGVVAIAAVETQTVKPGWVLRNPQKLTGHIVLEVRPGHGDQDKTVLLPGRTTALEPGTYEVLARGCVYDDRCGGKPKRHQTDPAAQWAQVFTITLPTPTAALAAAAAHSTSGTLTAEFITDLGARHWRARTLLQALTIICAYAGAVARSDTERVDGLVEDRIDALGVRDLLPDEGRVWNNMGTVAISLNAAEQIDKDDVQMLEERLGHKPSREEFLAEFDVEPCMPRESAEMLNRMRDCDIIRAHRDGDTVTVRVRLKPSARRQVIADGRFAVENDHLVVALPSRTLGLR